jgi:hypothetical protein
LAAAGCRVWATHICSIGALAAKTKNGRPSDTVSKPMSQGMGLPSAGGTQPSPTVTGSMNRATSSNASCMMG